MPKPLILHPDRLFPAEPRTRDIARALYASVRDLPIVSPHGHTDPRWFAYDEPFANPAELLIVPDHYVFRMLFSQGVRLDELGVPTVDGSATASDPRAIWRIFAANYHLFRGTPSRMWLDWVFAEAFGIDVRLEAETADHYYDLIDAALKTPQFRPRALFDRYNIEVIATTEGPLDPLDHHRAIRASGWGGKVVTAYRPDPVLDPDDPKFIANVQRFCAMAGEDAGSYAGYLRAHEKRRADFRAAGATSTDHGHPSAFTANLPRAEIEALYARVTTGPVSAAAAELFRGHMLTEMARMSIEDGMVMQLHPGVHRNHNAAVLARFGKDKGADIPTAGEFVTALKPLLDLYGTDPRLTLILFTLDEDVYSRELAPLAGHYPALKLGPPWWFHDSPEGMRRFRERATETAGFYNTVGFNDDTRAFLSIPARHDVARRMDCGWLAQLVVEHRMEEDEAFEVARALAYDLVKQAYKL
ncbi:MAG: glucuronate isomerase [Sphingobium sp.]|uniref:glucuronate isomerase n=1 Tax=Sphingobium sp. TaxID=1912891 RepID=UPI000C441BDE|nr:glucuronate isomerase [Sphingobium sp.]MBU0659639.1 glucuronate isomerase [Alphaproteobacteria bacterium]MBA4755600.1 glucuronate isomerase [Sphingobium sp.]MBS87555.1 glucuronate isomerase [Sphingobium sp.]MBU1793453.1 glucuronate isomerase [Alphaproteobacteria bacterium]TAJ75729.1 MAG: glucuronate isomerase [Sphingobium sp.]